MNCQDATVAADLGSPIALAITSTIKSIVGKNSINSSPSNIQRNSMTKYELQCDISRLRIIADTGYFMYTDNGLPMPLSCLGAIRFELGTEKEAVALDKITGCAIRPYTADDHAQFANQRIKSRVPGYMYKIHAWNIEGVILHVIAKDGMACKYISPQEVSYADLLDNYVRLSDGGYMGVVTKGKQPC